MSRKAVLIAVVFLVSTLSFLVTPATAQPSWRVYGWGAVTGYADPGGAYDASGGLFFSARGDKWMVWAYFRDPCTNELVYLRLVDLGDYEIYPDGMDCIGLWDVYVDWVYIGNSEGPFMCDWKEWIIILYDFVFLVEGSVMFSRVRPYYMIT